MKGPYNTYQKQTHSRMLPVSEIVFEILRYLKSRSRTIFCEMFLSWAISLTSLEFFCLSDILSE